MNRAIYLLSRISHAGGLCLSVVDTGRLGIGSIIVIHDRYSRIDAFWLIYHVFKIYHGGGLTARPWLSCA
jgi:hypothetical protein